MPRKYRPPTTRRRKERKTNVPYAMPAEPIAANGGSVAVEDDVDAAEATAAEAALEPAQPERESTRLSTPSRINRDYSYVRTELIRIAVVAVGLTIALIITAILR